MLKRIFTWWNGATLGALFDIHRRAVLVGKDEFGNRYFEEKKPSLEGRKRRYVIYSGLAEASRVSEAEAIRAALEATGGHRMRAAERLGISERTLRYRLADLRRAAA